MIQTQSRPLSESEARERRKRYGANVLVPRAKHPALLWLLKLFVDPMVLLLITAGVTYAVLGDRLDATVALAALVPIFLVTAVLETRSERALEALKKLTEPVVRVRRENGEVQIDATEIVPGDLLIVQEGDVFAADGIFASGSVLVVDESAMTGESTPVIKEPGMEVLAGTALRSGRGEVIVIATGTATKYGRIGTIMSLMHPGPTPIERVIRRLVWQLGAIVVVLCAAVILIERGHGHLWPAAIIAGVSLAMAAIPEELPMVYTLYLALGAWRLSKQRALVRRLASVETLGSASVICTDKTGTLTLGTLELAAMHVQWGDERDLLENAVLACEAQPYDPLDVAIAGAARMRKLSPPNPRDALKSYPFDPEHRRFTQIWRQDASVRVAVKGAFEAVLPLCALSPQERTDLQKVHERMAARGMRVIAVAHADRADRAQTRAKEESGLRLDGLLAFHDPVRYGVPESIAACARAGITVMMVTGDHPATAQAAAKAIGLRGDVLTGAELEALSDAELAAKMESVRIFARIQPEQKLRIVRALHARGEIVAMTGDGTNDALALRDADIGVAMGRRGTEVARNAADLVLLDDDFTTIVAAIAGGRRIFRNLRRAFRYLNAFHLPLIVSAVVLPFFNVPLLLLPVHLVWLELIVHPTSALVYENDPGGANDLMTQPPRGLSANLMRRRDWSRPVALGLTLTAGCLAMYFAALHTGVAAETARGIALTTLLVGQMLLVLTERSTREPVWRQSLLANPRLLPILAGTLCMLLAMLYVPALAAAFRLAPPHVLQFLAAAGVAALCTLWLEPFKRPAP